MRVADYLSLNFSGMPGAVVSCVLALTLSGCSTTPDCPGSFCSLESGSLPASSITASGSQKGESKLKKEDRKASYRELASCQRQLADHPAHRRPAVLNDHRRLRTGVWKSKIIEVDLLGLTVQDAMISIAEQFDIRISVPSDLNGLVASKQKGSHLVDALTSIMQSNGGDWRYDATDKTIYVASVMEGAIGSHKILSTYVTKARYLPAESIVAMLAPQFRRFVTTNKGGSRAGMIKVTAPTSYMEKIFQELNRIDRQPAQVMLDLAIYEIDQDASIDIGRADSANSAAESLSIIQDLSRMAGQAVLGTSAADIFLERIKSMTRRGVVEEVSSPRAVVVDGKMAEFMSTETIVGTVSNLQGEITASQSSLRYLKEVSLRTGMRVRPTILPHNEVMLEIDGAESASLGEGEQMQVKSHKLSTDVMIESGETLLLGGAVYNKVVKSSSGFSFLRDVPLFGWLFSSNSSKTKKVRVVFSIRPEILCQPIPDHGGSGEGNK